MGFGVLLLVGLDGEVFERQGCRQLRRLGREVSCMTAAVEPDHPHRAGLDGALLEIGVLDFEGDDPVVIHAMALRPKFYRFLR